MKTFFVDQGEFVGGAERFLIDFLGSLRPHEVRRVNPVVVGAKCPEYRRILPDFVSIEDFELPSCRGGIFRRFFAIFRIFSSAWRFKKLAKKCGATQFFTNTPRAHFVVLVAKIFFRLRGRWIAFFHDFTTRPRFLLRAIAGSAEICAANSIPTRKFLRDRIFPRDFEKIRIIENGVDFSKIPSCSPPKKIEKICVLGRIDPRKGQIFAVRVAEFLPEFNFFIVGNSVFSDKKTVEYEKKLRDFVAQKNLKNVFFLPAVEDPFEVISASDLILLPLAEAETFGRVAIESLAVRRLVIAFDETGPREILRFFEEFVCRKFGKKSIESLRVEPRNFRALAEKIRFFAENPKKTAEFLSCSREFVEKNFDFRETKKAMLGALDG